MEAQHRGKSERNKRSSDGRHQGGRIRKKRSGSRSGAAHLDPSTKKKREGDEREISDWQGCIRNLKNSPRDSTALLNGKRRASSGRRRGSYEGVQSETKLTAIVMVKSRPCASVSQPQDPSNGGRKWGDLNNAWRVQIQDFKIEGGATRA